MKPGGETERAMQLVERRGRPRLIDSDFDFPSADDFALDGEVGKGYASPSADYLQAYGEGGLKAHRLGALPYLARLYWYTVELGLIRTAAGLRIYGSGIVSSHAETVECREYVDSWKPRDAGE